MFSPDFQTTFYSSFAIRGALTIAGCTGAGRESEGAPVVARWENEDKGGWRRGFVSDPLSPTLYSLPSKGPSTSSFLFSFRLSSRLLLSLLLVIYSEDCSSRSRKSACNRSCAACSSLVVISFDTNSSKKSFARKEILLRAIERITGSDKINSDLMLLLDNSYWYTLSATLGSNIVLRIYERLCSDSPNIKDRDWWNGGKKYKYKKFNKHI